MYTLLQWTFPLANRCATALHVLWIICGGLRVPRTPLISPSPVRHSVFSCSTKLCCETDNEAYGIQPVRWMWLQACDSTSWPTCSRAFAARRTLSDRALGSLETRADRFIQQLTELKRRVGARLRVPHSGPTATSLHPVISRMTRLNPSVWTNGITSSLT